MKQTINDYASKSLGSENSYAVYTDKYDSSLLNAMPRELGRKDWEIDSKQFFGVDVWVCHEASFLTTNGLPVAGTLKFSYSSQTKLMVESKSMKLFLNSFDMCKIGSTIDNAIVNYCVVVKEELEKLLDCVVNVSFFKEGQKYFDLFSETELIYLDKIEGVEDIQFEDYFGKINHLSFQEEKSGLGIVFDNTYTTPTLRSRCRHTKQKDTGTAYIHIVSENGYIEESSLFKQIVSLRECNEFHELLAEKLMKDLLSVEGVKSCSVLLMYNRRGSLDINPMRISSNFDEDDIFLSKNLQNPRLLIKKTQFQ